MPESRPSYVKIDRNVWRAIGWILAAHAIESIQGWTGWPILAAFTMAAYGAATYSGICLIISDVRKRRAKASAPIKGGDVD